ncbi:DUF5114 domain-containing protein [Mangrovibacterium sp.]|uniref:DUF5114 domain-containing protein n=1 Tax=Mangrovibacterium sp. TaxID=1961364 RepID=UPI0035670EC2
MKTIKHFLIALMSIAAFTACEKDGDLITLSGLEQSELMATESTVVLTQETSAEHALSLTWTTSTLTVSDPTMLAPNVLSTTLQVSASEDFSGTIQESVESSLSHTYTVAQLNTIAKNLGATPDAATPVYFRLEASVGANMNPVYSNMITVNITTYEIDMSIGFILNSDQEATGATLYSADSDGEYVGFMGATAWYSFFLEEGDGTVWGNDAVSGTAFVTSSEDGSWNCWFPGQGGCYYVDFNTNSQNWSALWIPTLTVSGDISGELTFDRPNVKWTLPFTATSTTMTIQVSGTGNQYNNATGTDDEAAIDTPVAFAQNGSYVELVSQAGDITVTVPQAGDYTLTIDLSDPTAWTVEAVEGSEEPVVVNPNVYLPGVDDGISGNWTFDNALPLYNEENLAYAGVVNVNSLWGYTINIERDNWSDNYLLDSGDATSGTLVFQGNTNIPAPTAGLYLIDVSLNGLTYNLTALGNEIWVVGLDDQWNFNMPLTATATAGEYSGQITFAGASPWGFQIHLDSSWNRYFGGSSGSLHYRGSNITDDASLTAGTYTMTVNLIAGTYSITQ